jgi:tetratricopeptide (TPR) repeat protein
VRESVLGSEHVLVAKTIVNRANVYFKQGQYMRALADYSRALEIEKRSLGEEHVLVAKTKNNMGEALRVEGRLEEALQLYQESLAVLIKVVGGGHVLVANTKNNIAGIYLKQGKTEEALQCYMDALEVKQRVLGQDHAEVPTTRLQNQRKCLRSKCSLDSILSTLSPSHNLHALPKLQTRFSTPWYPKFTRDLQPGNSGGQSVIRKPWKCSYRIQCY